MDIYISKLINYISHNNLNDIINYLDNKLKEVNNNIILYNNLLTFKSLCQDINTNNNKNYKTILINNICYALEIYYKDILNILVSDYDYPRKKIVSITNDIYLLYNNKDYKIYNDKLIYETININLLDYTKTNINILFEKKLTIRNLKINLTSKEFKKKYNNNNSERIPYKTLQFKNNYLLNKEIINIDNLIITGNFNVLFIDMMTILYKISNITILENDNLILLYLNNSLINNGKLNFININKNKNFKIIITNNNLINNILNININNKLYTFNNKVYISLINNKDFYL